MKIIVAPDKFKGCLTSQQACESIQEGIMQAGKDAEVYAYPMADGGDGFAAVIKNYLHTQTMRCTAVDPLGRKISTTYEYDASTKTAIIELASASGIVLLKEAERSALLASTYGTGLQIKHAIENGAATIILGLGGSASTDAGTGILSALGFQLLDRDKNSLASTGECLQHIEYIIPPASFPNISFTVACDVQNVLFGKDGAAVVFAPQKGADENMVDILDKGLRHFATILLEQTKKDIAGIYGAGAAGGVAAGLSAFFSTEIVSGAALVVSKSGMEKQVSNAGIIVTGEGKLDDQTLQGKVVQHIVLLGKKYNVPVIAFCGELALDKRQIGDMGLSSAVSIAGDGYTKEESIKNATALLTEAVAKYFK